MNHSEVLDELLGPDLARKAALVILRYGFIARQPWTPPNEVNAQLAGLAQAFEELSVDAAMHLSGGNEDPGAWWDRSIAPLMARALVPYDGPVRNLKQFARMEFAREVADLAEAAGIELTASAAGDFVELLSVMIDRAGLDYDARRLALDFLSEGRKTP